MILPFLRIGGEPVEITLSKIKEKAMQAVNTGAGWYSLIRESFGTAWQRGVTIDSPRDILAFSPVFACVTVIQADIGKLRPRVVIEDEDEICTEVARNSPFMTVLNKPNKYQNRIQFIGWWIVSKLLHGNAYALKVRDAQRKVIGFYLLDPQRVTPLVADNGDVYYQLSSDHLARLLGQVTVPASEIVHDRMNCLWHPLVGISPIYACGLSATMGLRIQKNSTKFFSNMSRPSGMLTAPGSISDEVAGRLKTAWEENFGGENIGRLAVLGDNLKYEAMTIPPEQAQLIDQLKWTAEDVARVFHVPLYKIGGTVPSGSTIDALNQAYYSDCLQALIEEWELCMDGGLELPPDHYTDLDLDGLLRMDQLAQITALSESVKGSIRAPNEARKKLNLKPVTGGESPMSQQQNYSLAALAKRDAKEDPFATGPKPGDPAGAPGGAPANPPKPTPGAAGYTDDEEDDGKMLADLFVKGLAEASAPLVNVPALAETIDSQVRASVGTLLVELRNAVGTVSVLASSMQKNAERVEATLEASASAAKRSEDAQRRMTATVDRLVGVFLMPVAPVYDKNGVLIGSKRVEKLQEEA